ALPISIEILERASLFHPGDVETRFTQATIFNLMGEYESAIFIFKDLLHSSIDQDEIFYQIGQAYQNWEKYEEAIAHYKESIAINLNNEPALYELAHCLDLTGKLEDHLSYYKELVDRDPDRKSTRLNSSHVKISYAVFC